MYLEHQKSATPISNSYRPIQHPERPHPRIITQTHTLFVGARYYTVMIQKIVRSPVSPPPLKGESNSPTVSQVWIARRHNVASRRPIDIVNRHMKCGKGPISSTGSLSIILREQKARKGEPKTERAKSKDQSPI